MLLHVLHVIVLYFVSEASAVGCGSEVPLGVLCEEKVIAALGTVISTAYSHRQTE